MTAAIPSATSREPKREFWWIHSDYNEAWAGTRIAVFLPETRGHVETLLILGDGFDRMGLRVWADIQAREGWRKVKRIDLPTAEEIARGAGE